MFAEKLEALLQKATEGPVFVGHDDALDCPAHARSGLSCIDTGRQSDWPIARLMETHEANLIALLYSNAPALLAVVKAAQEVCKECGVCGGSGRENYEDDNGEYVAEACGQCSELRQALTRLSERRD